MPIPAVPVLYHEPVRWGDVDPVAITRYDAYLRFVEIGEDELWRSVGVPLHDLQEQFDVWFPRKLMHVDYHVPSRLSDLLTIVTYLSRVGTTGCTLHVDVMDRSAGVLHAAAHLVLVCVTRADFAKCAIPPALRPKMLSLVTTVDAARASARERADALTRSLTR